MVSKTAPAILVTRRSAGYAFFATFHAHRILYLVLVRAVLRISHPHVTVFLGILRLATSASSVTTSALPILPDALVSRASLISSRHASAILASWPLVRRASSATFSAP